MLKTSIVLLLLLALSATCLRQPDIPSEDLNTLVNFFKQANAVAKIAVKDYAEKKDMSNRLITMKEDPCTKFQESVDRREIKKERQKDLEELLKKGLTSADFSDERTMIPNVMDGSTVPISVRNVPGIQNVPSKSFSSLSINYHGLSSDPVSLKLKSKLLNSCSWKMDKETHKWKFSPPLTNFLHLMAVVPEDVKKDSVLPLPSDEDIRRDRFFRISVTDLKPLVNFFKQADAVAKIAVKDYAEKKDMSDRLITTEEDQSTNFQESVDRREIKKERQKDLEELLKKGKGRAKLTSADFVDERTMIPNVMDGSTVPISVRNVPSKSFSLSINYHGLSSDPVSLKLKSKLLKPWSWEMDKETHEWKFSPPLRNFLELIAVVPKDVTKDSVLPLPSNEDIKDEIMKLRAAALLRADLAQRKDIRV